MIKVAQIPEIERNAIEKTINRNLAREGLLRRRVQEVVRSETMIWMPYYEINYAFTVEGRELRIDQEPTGSGKTALNAMFGPCVEEESDILSLFRPDILDVELRDNIPRSNDVVGSIGEVNSQLLLDKLIAYRAEIGIELQEIGFELRKLHRRMQTMSLFLPTSKATRVREDELTQRLAQLSGVKFSLRMRLGLPENATITQVSDGDVFYCPQLVVSVEHQQTGMDRFLIVDFVRLGRKMKGGGLDDALSRLCSVDDACRATLEAAINK